ncbi:hypothetical protein BH10PSE19_BH10PSE19_01080 [soil metagenome]
MAIALWKRQYELAIKAGDIGKIYAIKALNSLVNVLLTTENITPALECYKQQYLLALDLGEAGKMFVYDALPNAAQLWEQVKPATPLFLATALSFYSQLYKCAQQWGDEEKIVLIHETVRNIARLSTERSEKYKYYWQYYQVTKKKDEVASRVTLDTIRQLALLYETDHKLQEALDCYEDLYRAYTERGIVSSEQHTEQLHNLIV